MSDNGQATEQEPVLITGPGPGDIVQLTFDVEVTGLVCTVLMGDGRRLQGVIPLHELKGA